MKVIDFIKRLNEIGYDENTELTFSCCDGETGEWYDLKLDTKNGDGFCYGEDLYGTLYDKKEINIEIDVDGCEEYLDDKFYDVHDLLDTIEEMINEYKIRNGVGYEM